MKLGNGTHVYELEDGWAKVPAGVQLGYTHGVVTDAQDRVYVFNQSPHAVAVFSRDGVFEGAWGKEFAQGAHGMRLYAENGQEVLYLVDYVLATVVKTTLDGKELLRLPPPQLDGVYDSEHPYRPTEVAVAPTGDIYVCDGYGQHWIHRYNREGRYLGSFGGPGTAAGQLQQPHGINLDVRNGSPRLCVADRANVRFQWFSLEGEPLAMFSDGLRYPCTAFFSGEEMIVPDLHGVVSIFDHDNRLIVQLGDNPGVWKREGWPNIPHSDRKPGLFISPHNACVDAHGDLYVVEWVSDGRITKLRRKKA